MSPQESLIDASEDSQLEAAIRASLQETHYDSRQEKAESENDSDAEAFSDSEGMISVDCSDSEGGGKDSIDGNTSSEQALPTSSDSPAQNRKAPHKESNHRKEESKKNHVEPQTRPSLKPAASQHHHHHHDQSHKITSSQNTQPEDNGTNAHKHPAALNTKKSCSPLQFHMTPAEGGEVLIMNISNDKKAIPPSPFSFHILLLFFLILSLLLFNSSYLRYSPHCVLTVILFLFSLSASITQPSFYFIFPILYLFVLIVIFFLLCLSSSFIFSSLSSFNSCTFLFSFLYFLSLSSLNI